MKDNYNIDITLKCGTCGGEAFEFNDDKTYVKCKLCNRDYLNGYDELLAHNQETVNSAVEDISREVKSDIIKKLKGALKGR